MTGRLQMCVVDAECRCSDRNSVRQAFDNFRFDTEAEIIGRNENVCFAVECASVRHDTADVDSWIGCRAQLLCGVRHAPCNDKPAPRMRGANSWPHSLPEP